MTALAPSPNDIKTRGPLRWAVVGGGLLGMQLAARLRVAGNAVTLIEAAPHLGGLADAWQLGEVTWDRHYHVLLLSDLRTRALLDSLGLGNDVEWRQTKTGFYTDGRHYSMSNSVEFLRFPPLGLVDKFRLGATIFAASKIKDWKKLEKIPVETWLRKWSGRRTTEKIWLPLLRAKLGENYKHASAAFIWAIIARMYAARKSGLKKEMFGYVKGGYAKVLERFEQKLRDVGVDIQTGRPVKALSPSPLEGEGLGVRGDIRNDSIALQFCDGESDTFDRVAVTAAAPIASKLCPDLTAAEHARLNAIRYQGIVCASLLLKKPLAGFYVTNITDPAPFTAVIETTALVDPATFRGRHLVYLPKYVPPDDPLFAKSDDEIRASFLPALFRMHPHLSADDVLAFRVSRAKHVLAVSTLNYSETVPPVTTSVPGLYLCNSSQIVNGTLNVNETLTLADRSADALLAEVLA
jgi:protoporphyrinogen oxidase